MKKGNVARSASGTAGASQPTRPWTSIPYAPIATRSEKGVPVRAATGPARSAARRMNPSSPTDRRVSRMYGTFARPVPVPSASRSSTTCPGTTGGGA